MFATNKDALSQLRKGFDVRGNNLSPMVWKLADQTKTQLEYYLQTGLSVGRSAIQIGQDLRQMLNKPDKRFRRVRDKNGKLVMSQPMKNYHPGQGVYRSAKMNALRLTATSTNMSYRAADYERWSKQGFTLGIEIQRSANNKGPCKICDAMVGKYPKTFKFTGFHPFCICFAIPIVMEPEDLADYLLTDEVPKQLIITSIPQRARKFVNENKDDLQSAYWYKDNFDDKGKIIHGIHPTKREITEVFPKKILCSDTSVKLKPTAIKDISDIQSNLEHIVSEHPEYFPRGYKGITAVSREHTYMSTDINGNIIVNFATDKNGFNPGESIVSALDKIKKGSKLTEHEEYSIEALWHEVLHNKSKNTANLPDLHSALGFQRVVAETVNQLVARHSYDNLLKQLGGIAKHKKWILDNGYGYKETVSNLRSLISKAGINEKAFVREANKILMEDYTDIDVKIRGLLQRMYKGTKNVGEAFDKIEIKDFSRFLKILD